MLFNFNACNETYKRKAPLKMIIVIIKRGKRDKIIILEIYFLHKFYVINNKLINQACNNFPECPKITGIIFFSTYFFPKLFKVQFQNQLKKKEEKKKLLQ